MEIFGAISTGDDLRSSDLNGIYSSQEMDDHMSSDCSVPHYELNPNVANSGLDIPFSIWPSNDSTIVHDMSSFDEIQTYHHFLKTASPLGSDELFNNFGDGDDNHDWISVNQWESCAMTVQPDQSDCNSKKRPRSNDDQALKSKRSVKARKVNDYTGSETEEDVTGRPVSPTTPLTTFEHSNGFQEELGDGTTLGSSPKGKKTRASRGSATDPQSVYARKRREKINERLKVLQNLVPNGTKVDISTMLEEAVDYVKFLQLQIKLLSADDLWMYAPIAYNGMDIGVDRLRLTAQGLL